MFQLLEEFLKKDKDKIRNFIRNFITNFKMQNGNMFRSISKMLTMFFFLYVQPKHKIQSNAPLQLHMVQSPKMMAPLVKEWVPQAFTVSFKVKMFWCSLICTFISYKIIVFFLGQFWTSF